MRTRSIRWTPVGILVALAATASSLGAQTTPQPTPLEARALTVESALPLPMPVVGLTPENADDLRAVLTALTVAVHVCEPCKLESARAGECKKCGTALQPATRPLLVEVTPALEERSIRLMLDGRRPTRLSAIEAALGKRSVTIDPQRMRLPGRILLVVRGGGTEELAAIERALLDAKVFDEATATFDAATSEIRVDARARTAPTRAAVLAALEARKLQLADVIFGNVGRQG